MRRKPVVGYEGVYAISRDGRAFSRHSGEWRQLAFGGGDYRMVMLQRDGVRQPMAIHVLVAEAFIGPKPSPRHVVNHKDGNKKNNHVSNLEWATRKEDRAHAIRTGLFNPVDNNQTQGTDHWNARLNESKVRDIRRRVAAGEPRASVAKRYRITSGSVHDIVRLRSWAHLKPRPDEVAPDCIGAHVASSKLTDKKVRAARRRHDSGESMRSIAKSLGVSVGAIHKIVHRQTWTHVD